MHISAPGHNDYLIAMVMAERSIGPTQRKQIHVYPFTACVLADKQMSNYNMNYCAAPCLSITVIARAIVFDATSEFAMLGPWLVITETRL